MDFLLEMMSMISPMPKITASQTYTPPPQPTRDVPFNWTPVVAIGVVTILALALMKETRK